MLISLLPHKNKPTLTYATSALMVIERLQRRTLKNLRESIDFYMRYSRLRKPYLILTHIDRLTVLIKRKL